MSQISSLGHLNLWGNLSVDVTVYPGAKDCLKNLSELHCALNIESINSEFLYQLSQICHNLLLLNITIIDEYGRRI